MAKIPPNITCIYCRKLADGPMLYMGTFLAVNQPSLAHAKCVQEKLDKLLNPDDEDSHDN